MIASFDSKPLARYWTKGDSSKIRADWRDRVTLVLDLLDASTRPEQLNVPSFKWHRLTGDRSGTYAVSVSRNWRITFRWEGEFAVKVDLEDYHGK